MFLNFRKKIVYYKFLLYKQFYTTDLFFHLIKLKRNISKNTNHMEYHMFNHIRNRRSIPYWLRIVIAVFCIIMGLLGVIFPVIPWIPLFIIAWILFIPWRKLIYLMKIRKSIIYLIVNIRSFQIIKYKIKDIYINFKKIILNYKKKKKRKKFTKKFLIR